MTLRSSVLPQMVNYVKGESGTDLVIQAHQQITLNIFTPFRSDSRRPLHRSAIIESLNLCQTHIRDCSATFHRYRVHWSIRAEVRLCMDYEDTNWFFRRLADSDKHLHSRRSRVRVRASVAICPLLLSMAVSLMVIWQWQSGRPTSPGLPESVPLLVQSLSPPEACRFG